ncbi:hypothetical protein ACWGDD_36090 [Streptomyces sp. NPDC055011]|uniref:hypothetical protein n=1 Tax=Micromonospora sp. CB01531 TaxID=1718947 RepID=UPI00093FC88F|nr:hypothetical protein [Micromonospora sp. CB01531]OKI54509.1 hypothetical protein A6A27_31790 [Micromonospora sp. CB01531]
MFTIADLEIPLRRSILPAEEPYYQYLIDQVTAYIETVTGVAFTLHTNETVRYRADGHGIVELVGPVVEVANIAPLIQSNYTYRYDGWYWMPAVWDGLSDIEGLAPYEVVDVTYTYGYDLDEVPQDIKGVAMDAVLGKVNGRTPGDLEEKTVGDITYKWRVSEADFDAFGLEVLRSYQGVARTWRL